VIIVILTLGLLLSTRLDLGSTTAGLVTRNQTKTSGGLVTRSQPRAGVDKAWSKLQDQRRARVAEVCAKYGKKTRVPEHYDRFFFAPSYNLMMCATAKAGSTTYMLTTFNQILEGDDFRPVVEPDGGFHGFSSRRKKVKLAFSNQDLIKEKVHHPDTVSFTVVRHPFERLVSAYREKTEKGREGLGDLSFSSFLQKKVIKEYHSCQSSNFSCMNLHWKPFLNNCSPCTVNYTAICKIETFAADKAGLHGMVGLAYKQEGQVHYNNGANLLNSTNSTEDWTRHMFQDISEHTKKILREIYRYDLEMFDYDPWLY